MGSVPAVEGEQKETVPFNRHHDNLIIPVTMGAIPPPLYVAWTVSNYYGNNWKTLSH